MNKFALVFVTMLSLSGCTIGSKVDAVRAAADQNLFEGLDKYSKFAISFPGSHPGPYQSTDQLNFKIVEGKYKGKNASAIVGKSENTGVWEVLMLMVDENGKWVRLKKPFLN